KFGISQPVRRREDARLITGKGSFADDVNVPGQARAAFLRSTHGHGLIRRIDAGAARNAAGVLAVITGEDLRAAGVGYIPYLALGGFTMDPPTETPRPALAQDRVRHVGEPIAMVVAETLAQAVDACEKVRVDIQPLPAVTDVERAVADGAPVLWPGAPNNMASTWRYGDRAAVEKAFANAAHVTTVKLVNNRVLANPIEPRSCIGSYDLRDASFTLISPSQGAHFFHRVLCEHVFNMPRDKMRIRTSDVGGAFGCKEQPYPEDIAVLHAARTLGRPVKWSGTRSEHFLSDNHARDAVIEAALALDASGRFLAIKAKLLDGIGAYCSCHGAHISIRNTTNGLPLMYDVPLLDVEISLVLTNTAPIGPYRGAGREQASYITERLVEQAARELRIDPVDLRRRNLIPTKAIPYKSASGQTYDSGDFEGLLEKTLALSDWDGFDERVRVSAKKGLVRGRGLSCFVECVGAYPFEGADIRFEADGGVTVVTATQSSGQGHETSFAQLAAERLGIPFDKVRIKENDSSDLPKGLASVGSRSMIMAGSAIAIAGDAVIEKGRSLASHVLEVSKADLEFRDGSFCVRGTDISIGLLDLAVRVRSLRDLPPDLPATLDSTGEYSAPGLHHPNGSHVCEVEIDPETGKVDVVAYCAVDDVGTIINPLIVHGQIHGGVAQGIGQVLLERIAYDDDGQLLTGSLMDYGLPRADNLPALTVDFHPTPSTKNPIGVKGTGECGVTGSIPAVLNAVNDALARAGAATALGLPVTPEKVWRSLRDVKTPQARRRR
ncbi:MAG TPA: xanthine dehydrogenase family protein molybdopterin-binding subunit, partial [Pseudolabrys sp.]|nr:xanthine dehydrogenase family protein molybdopterin-binding subunit [Pseudolabrys sp.]